MLNNLNDLANMSKVVFTSHLTDWELATTKKCVRVFHDLHKTLILSSLEYQILDPTTLGKICVSTLLVAVGLPLYHNDSLSIDTM